ncbi:MAG: flavin reductase [Gemmatimonadetes bacterium]|nr:flavin reductase [Gemmatimonadota bacterium]
MSGSSLPNQPVGPDEFRRLLSYFPAGVTVATTLDAAGRPQGMTASAVVSASLEPPLVLLCVDHTADFHAAITVASGFALSVLAGNQEHLSRRFAEENPDKFSGVAVHPGPGGLPLLDGAVAYIVCDNYGAHEVGDHTVFICRVTGGEALDGRPLVHFRGGYATTTDVK